MFSQLFALGHVVITEHARDELDPSVVATALQRHVSGDWGDLGEANRRENDLAVQQGFRIFSAYNLGGSRFWIITEADRSATTVLLPDDY